MSACPLPSSCNVFHVLELWCKTSAVALRRECEYCARSEALLEMDNDLQSVNSFFLQALSLDTPSLVRVT